jgi:uncharacterized protein (TIGR00369 family)
MSRAGAAAEVPAGFVPIDTSRNAFVSSVGPLHAHLDEGRAGRLVLGLRVEPRHCSSSGFCHGGMLSTLGDMLLVIGANLQADIARFMTTVRLSVDFLAPVPQGAWIEGRLDVLRSTRSLIFCQGLFTVDGAPVMRVDGIVKPIGDTGPQLSARRYFAPAPD